MRPGKPEEVASSAPSVREIIAKDECTPVPCVFDAMSGLMVQRAGYPMTFVSGGLTAAAMGLPDLGLATMTEIAGRMGEIAQCLRIPVLGDADTGYGNALNVVRTVETFERAGLAGLMIEDQVFPKRCGHLMGKAVISRQEMVQKVRAARDAAFSPDFIVVGRTDASAIEGIEAAIDRGNAYGDAGADVVFIETPRSEADIEKIARGVRFPKMTVSLAGVGMPSLPRARLRALGFRLVMHPADLAQVALKAMEEMLQAIAADKPLPNLVSRAFSFQQLHELIRTPEYLQLEKNYA